MNGLLLVTFSCPSHGKMYTDDRRESRADDAPKTPAIATASGCGDGNDEEKASGWMK